MNEPCRICKKEMKFIREYNEDGFNYFIYECHNENCDDPQRRVYSVCENCEQEDMYEESIY